MPRNLPDSPNCESALPTQHAETHPDLRVPEDVVYEATPTSGYEQVKLEVSTLSALNVERDRRVIVSVLRKALLLGRVATSDLVPSTTEEVDA